MLPYQVMALSITHEHSDNLVMWTKTVGKTAYNIMI